MRIDRILHVQPHATLFYVVDKVQISPVIDTVALNRAVIRFLGFGTKVCPTEDAKALYEEFDLETAAALEVEVRRLLDELDGLKPDWKRRSLVSAGTWAKQQMKNMHPEFDRRTLDALEWVVTWWWR